MHWAGGGWEPELFDCLKQHKRDALAGRWNQFSWFGARCLKENEILSEDVEGAHSKHSEVLNHIEEIQIHTYEPKKNRQGG